MGQTVLGVFSDRTEADRAVTDLETRGYSTKEMSIIMKDEAAAEANTGSKIGEGAASGVVTGGVIGGLAGLLIGIGAITIPGIGALLIGGPLAAALGLTGAAAATASGALTGALAGGLIGALVNIGVPEETAKVYEDRVREGGVLLAVPTLDDRPDEVKTVMEAHGADQITAVDNR
jgi:uncharacterized membrane protein